MGYREVKCPSCHSIFELYNDNANQLMCGSEETGQYLKVIFCPNCKVDMFVLDDVIEGVDINRMIGLEVLD